MGVRCDRGGSEGVPQEVGGVDALRGPNQVVHIDVELWVCVFGAWVSVEVWCTWRSVCVRVRAGGPADGC